MTVTGPVAAADLGVVLPHEHVFVNVIREYRGEGLMNDPALAVEEVGYLARAGGGTLVDLTTTEIGRDPLGLAHVSESTGVKIVMGCGHYRDPYLDRDWFDRNSVDEIAAELVAEARDGVAGTGVRPGIIGEIGSDKWYVSAAEERSFRAAARAHLETGLTISTHAARWPVGVAQLALLEQEGVDPRRVIIGHADMVNGPEYQLELARRGCFVELDGFGTDSEYDMQRGIGFLMRLRSEGHLRQVLLSQDVFLRSHLHARGGCGYDYIQHTLLPRLRGLDLTPAELDLLTKDNPRAALTGERI
jgi:predicted metal-dependent phosphotriesterase family hydrolase